MKLNLGCGADWLAGFENLDRRVDWTFESGLPYPDDSAFGVTISHALMYVSERDWPGVFADCYRVLIPGGVIRITEDDHESDTSKRKNDPWPGMITRTGPALLRKYLEAAGFTVYDVARDETRFSDRSLIQAWRSDNPPYYFFIEGLKPQLPDASARNRPKRSPSSPELWRRARRAKFALARTVLCCTDMLRRLPRRAGEP